jgi:hypothetical protein
MKLNASTAIALALAFTSVAGNSAAAVAASSVSGSSNPQEQRITLQGQTEYAAATRGYCFRSPWGIICC